MNNLVVLLFGVQIHTSHAPLSSHRTWMSESPVASHDDSLQPSSQAWDWATLARCLRVRWSQSAINIMSRSLLANLLERRSRSCGYTHLRWRFLDGQLTFKRSNGCFFLQIYMLDRHYCSKLSYNNWSQRSQVTSREWSCSALGIRG